MDIKDFIVKKLTDNNIEESDSNEIGTHEQVDDDTFQKYIRNNLDNTNKMSETLPPSELNNITTDSGMTLTKKLINLGKLSIIPVTLSMLIASMSFLDTPTSSKDKEINTINKIVKASPIEYKRTVKKTLLVKKPEIIKKEIVVDKKEDKTIKRLEPSSQTIIDLMNNENSKMYSGVDKFSEPFWDIKQWTVGYGTSIKGIDSQENQSESIKPKKGWVDKFRKIHGNIPKHPDDLEPGENKKFPLGRVSHNTSLAALEFFHKKNSERLKKEYKFIELMPKNVKDAIYDMSFNMGSNFFSKFVKFKKNLKVSGSLLKKLKTQKLSSKEKKKLEKKINIYFTKAAKEIIDSDYFRESHVKRKNKIIEKQKQKQKTKKSFKYPKDYIEISRPYKMIMLVIQGNNNSLSSKKEKYAKKLINESLLIDYIKQIILS